MSAHLLNIHGIIPALSTTTDERGELDDQSLTSLVEYNVRWGVHAVAVSIVAGEFYKFSDRERERCFRTVVEEAGGKIPVWAGVSHMGTDPAVRLGRFAKEVGADGIIAMPPLVGNKSDAAQEHFSQILEKVDLPLMIQDAEDFSGTTLPTSLYAKLSREHSNLVAIKVEGGDTLRKIEEVVSMPEARNFKVIGGMAARLLFEELDRGATGNIPDACLTDLLVQVYEDYTTGKVEAAQRIFARYKPWVDFLTRHSVAAAEIEKETLKIRRVIKSSQTRTPHIPLDPDSKKELASIVRKIFPTGG